MVGGIKQDDEIAARGIIERSRAYSKKVYNESGRWNNTAVIGHDDKDRVITNPFQCSHRFKVVESNGSDVVENVVQVWNHEIDEWEDRMVYRIGDVIVFKMDGSKGMNTPAMEGWVTDNAIVKCGGLRYLANSIAPKKNEKLVCGEQHALELLEKHRAMCRGGRKK
jgi:hypothetical protein